MPTDTPTDQELRDRLRQLEAFMAHSPAAACMKDEKGRYVYSNERMASMFYAPLSDLEGKTDFDWLPEYLASQIWQSDQAVLLSGKPSELVQTVPTTDGKLLYWLMFKFPFTNARGEKFVGAVAVDITELKEVEARLEEMKDQLQSLSLTDDLTALNNRRGFMHLAEDRLKLARREEEKLLLIFADLDGLKRINDNYGHAAGSRMIEAAADLLRDSFRQSDVIARWGGDEFVVLLGKAAGDKEELIMERVDGKIADFNAASGWPYELSISFGMVTIDVEGGRPFDEMILEADKAMYENKAKRRREREDGKAVS